jgi:hypothetical protein
MRCTRCKEKIVRGEKYWRTSKGAHHHECPGLRRVAVELFGVEPYSVLDAIQHACGILDVVKAEWGEEWTEHDQKVRAGLSLALLEVRGAGEQN